MLFCGDCSSASWLRLVASLFLGLQAALCTNFTGFWGLCLFSAFWRCLMATLDSDKQLWHGSGIPVLAELALPPESWPRKPEGHSGDVTAHLPGARPWPCQQHSPHHKPRGYSGGTVPGGQNQDFNWLSPALKTTCISLLVPHSSFGGEDFKMLSLAGRISTALLVSLEEAWVPASVGVCPGQLPSPPWVSAACLGC